ncbi:MAG: type I restriction enzyme HsdR N-terminal domain-containing protein, partial [Cyanobacteria bacterium P01_H01_bin.105]
MPDAKSFFNPELCCNETEVESKFIVHYLLPALGYTPGDWGQEVTFGNFRLDFLAIAYSFFPIKHKFRLVIEAKGPKASLASHVGQIKRYQTRFQARYGLLTNG